MSRFSKITFKVLDILIITMMIFGSPMTALAEPSPTGATITTQLPDYPPGALVQMTGAGWAEYESVHIVVNADDGSWTLESSPDPVADGAGEFTYEFQLPAWFVPSYSVSATGFTSGTATVSFTDLNVGTYDQCANDDNSVPPGTGYTSGDLGCQWINGNLQSNTAYYAEGDATVQRVWLTDFTPGPHTLTLQYGTTKGGKHAYDFLTTWNWSENWIIEADRCQGITGCVAAAGSENGLDIPQDPSVPDSFEPSAPGARQFVMRGATLTSATTPVIESGSYAGDSETIITVSFNVPSSGPMCTASGCSVALWFGAHVSAQANWGLGLGAGSISGSPYHVALYRVDSASVGQRDNQMQSNVVSQIPNGTIVIIKDAVPNDAQDFSFNLNNNSTISQNFSLDDDADGTLPNSQTFSVPPGTWTASELNIPSGWTLSNLTCSVAGTNGSTFIVSGAAATITLKSGTTSGDTVTCTYTDTRNTGSLELSKSLTGGPGGYTGPFTIAYDCDGTAYDGSVSVSAGGSQTVSGIPSGTSCTVSEPTLPSVLGYTFGTPTFSPSATVTIGAGTTVEVTTNNTLSQDTGSLKINKSLSNLDGASVPASFTINYDCGGAYAGSVSVAAGGSQSVSGIPTGSSCTVSEPALTPIPGYTWGTAIVTGSPATIGKNTTVEVSVANSITRDLGNFKITKTTSNPDGATLPAAFTGTYDCGTGYTGNWSVANGGSQTVSGIPTGNTCSVVETAPAAITGYTWAAATYTPSSIIISDKDGTFEVVVGNSITRDLGNFKITKTTSNPDGATLPAAFTGTYDCGTGYTGNWSVANGGSQTISGIPTGNTCSVVETAPAAITGYTWGAPTYTPSSIVISDKGGTFEVVVGNSITRDLGNFKITKTTSNPDGATLPAAFTGTYDCGTGYTGNWSVANGGSQTVSGIPTGNSCSVTEDALAPISGYTWGTPTFTPSSIVISTKAGTFEIVVGNSITRDRGGLEITKSTFNPDGVTLPSFVMNYDCGLDTNGSALTGSKTIASGGSAIVGGIPTGNICSVTEVAPTAIQDYTWADPTYTPASIVISKKAVFLIEVRNSITRDRGSFKITKSTNNPDGATLPDAFTGTYDCGTFSGGKYSEFKGTFSVADGGSQTISGIPTGNTCSVVETAPAPIAGYTWGPISYTPPTITIGAKDGTFEIVVGNSITRDRGSFKITKTTSNPDGATLPSAFTGTYDCGVGYTGNWSVANGGSQTITGIPTGNSCSVTEDALAPISGYTWGTPTFTPSSIVISTKGGTFEIVVGNSITRDRGSLTIVKKVINDNGGTATVSAFGLITSAGSLTFDSGTANGSTTTYTSQKITVVTGNYTLKENDVYGYTEGTWSCTNGTANPTTYNGGSVNVDKDKDVVCTITNNDQPGTIVIIKNAKPANGSFAFTTTGTGYNGFTLTGATTGGGNVNTQTLNAGTYTVKEGTQLAWYLTGIGGSTDPNTPYNCVVTGSGGSTGVGDLNTATATINLKNGDMVTCTFENTGVGATRTQGFWATHSPLANIAWNGGTAFGHTFPGVTGTTGIGNKTLCSRTLGINEVMGGFWSDVSKKTTGAKRSALDQARMQLLQQLLAAELNASAFGSVPAGGSGQFAIWEAAYCGTNQTAIQNALRGAASFNNSGDSVTFTPGTSADSKNARTIANKVFWDTLP